MDTLFSLIHIINSPRRGKAMLNYYFFALFLVKCNCKSKAVCLASVRKASFIYANITPSGLSIWGWQPTVQKIQPTLEQSSVWCKEGSHHLWSFWQRTSGFRLEVPLESRTSLQWAILPQSRESLGIRTEKINKK